MSTHSGDPAARRAVDSVDHLLACAELHDVRYERFSMERRDGDDSPKGDEPRVRVTPQLSEDGTVLRALVSLEHETEDYEFGATVQIRYRLAEPIAEPPDEVIGDFLGRSVLMTAVPFLREALSASGARFGLATPVIGLFRGEPLHRDPDPAPAAEQQPAIPDGSDAR